MKIFQLALSLSLVSLSIPPSAAQKSNGNQIVKEVLRLDSLFWLSYNRCDVDKMKTFFTDDLEFYHDKNGLTVGLDTFEAASRSGLCGQPDWKLRREALHGTVKVYPLSDYGAIINGEHVFYVTEKGNPEYLDGQALFTHVWLRKDNQWKMARVLSYNHGPATYRSEKKAIRVSAKELSALPGGYDGANIKNIQVTVVENQLHIKAGDKIFVPQAESVNKFFLEERDLQFEFIKDNNGIVNKLVVWEKGKIVEEALKKTN
jgi:hypothetical protein